MNNETQEKAAALRSFAAHMQQRLDEVEKEINVDLQRMDGSTKSTPLREAKDYAGVEPEELRPGAESIILDTKLKDHDQQSLAKSRAEPESARRTRRRRR